jgi:hypothetical protein
VSLSEDTIRKMALQHSLVFRAKEIWVSGLPTERPTEAGDSMIVGPAITATINVLVCTRLRCFSINMLRVIHPDFSKTGPSVAGVLALTIQKLKSGGSRGPNS